MRERERERERESERARERERENLVTTCSKHCKGQAWQGAGNQNPIARHCKQRKAG